MIKKYSAIIALLVSMSFLSCNSRKATFLDFEFGMTYSEYMKHAKDLLNSGLIRNLNGNEFDYSIKLSDDKSAYFHVTAYVFGHSSLSMIEGRLQAPLTAEELKLLYKVFESKHGKPSQPFYKDDSNHLWYAIWDKDENIDIRLVLSEERQQSVQGSDYGAMLFTATGSLGDKIEEKDKKNKGSIKVNNTY